MSTADINGINILHLPDKILLDITNKLNMIDVLYSLVGVNSGFNRSSLHSSSGFQILKIVDSSLSF
jgi:hypothetical protein